MTDRTLDPKAVKEGLRQRLQAYMIPRRIVCLERLPLNLNGKVDRRALAAVLEAEKPQHG